MLHDEKSLLPLLRFVERFRFSGHSRIPVRVTDMYGLEDYVQNAFVPYTDQRCWGCGQELTVGPSSKEHQPSSRVYVDCCVCGTAYQLIPCECGSAVLVPVSDCDPVAPIRCTTCDQDLTP